MARTDDATKIDSDEGRTEALHALLSSLSPGSSTGADGETLTTNQVRRISDKLGEILGAVPESGVGARRNEKGELVNEEGLPIIDINEPVTAADYAFRPDPNSDFDDPDLLPLWTLSEEEKGRRKAERERILDLLEEEEDAQQARDAENTRKRLEQELQRRKEATKEEVDKLKKARELQKKLGKALIRSVVESRDQADKEKVEQEEQDRLTAAARPLKPKKSVSFADTSPEEISPPDSDAKNKGVDWGDVAPGTLRKAGPSNCRADRPVMKMHVVERRPSGLRSPGPPARDSDDESDPESYGAQYTDDDEDYDHYHPRSDEETSTSHRMQSPPPESVDSEEDHLADEEPSEWTDEDFDTARHQREVALEYYEKRKTVGAEVASAMRAHDHGDGDWDQPEVPLEATLASDPPKPSLSRFSIERHIHPPPNTGMLASHSLGAAVLPLASAASLQRAVRLGKFEDGKLVGGAEGESEDEGTAVDESAQQLLEAILRGEVTNVGPQSSSASTRIVPTNTAETTQPSVPAQEPSTLTARPNASKVSKFKLALQQPHTMTGQISPGLSSTTATPTNGLERSSPKPYAKNDSHSDPTQGTSSLHPLPKLSSTRSISSDSLPSAGNASRQMPSMIVESPSFRPPRVPNTSGSSSSPGQPRSLGFQSVVLEVPSFQPPSVSSSPLSSSSTAVATPVSAAPSPSIATPSLLTPKVPTPVRAGVVERKPPSFVDTVVRETTASIPGPVIDGPERKPKVSRFKAQRS
ncbi:hypothetical protein PHLGIDRAFT_124164 [Phlebiopsis gigantea 11061_1 CR5-6]|uniref:DUF3835 domain-containing protein n=1 Tax=Phlebiopsis gigantea (strain 11061_1 CR5-6) TaxID=745531 RepID=A0A0C3S770_PHLG1|nr:hypothetical protein PHLGIDRAFT_124164 [Phlebiopsis gigantea 11061_1 CR5-6]